MTYLVHVGYGLMLIALLARDILWLRSILVAAQGLLACYAWFRGVPQIAYWNLLFVVINSIWVMQILRERRAVAIPAELRELYERHFAALAPAEFLNFWAWGERCQPGNGLLVRQHERPEALYFLLAGEVSVRAGGRELVRLQAGSFVAEMSLLTGEMATADVMAGADVELIRWPAARLQQLRLREPALWTRVQSVLGHDLVEKIRRSAVTAA